MFQRTAVIPRHRLTELQSKVEKLARKAVKLGLVPPALRVVGDAEPRKVYHPRDEFHLYPKYIAAVEVEVTGEQPKFDGWSLRGTVVPVEGTNPTQYLVNRVPVEGETAETVEPLPLRFRTAGMVCDHCRKVRSRNKAVILSHADGSWAQVGTTCISAYLPGVTPEQLLAASEWFGILEVEGECDDERGYWGGAGYRETLYPTADFLAVAVACISAHGYVPGSFEGLTTKADTFNHISGDVVRPASNPSQRDIEAYEAIMAKAQAPEVAQRVATVREWVAGLDVAGNDYLYNLQVACGAEFVTYRTGGYAVSAFSAYDRAQERELERSRAVALPSHHVGTVGERVTLTGCLVTRANCNGEGQWGPSTMVKFTAPDGAQLVWWATGDHSDLQGQTVTVTGTVKKQDAYRDVPQTTLTRCKVAVEAAAA